MIWRPKYGMECCERERYLLNLMFILLAMGLRLNGGKSLLHLSFIFAQLLKPQLGSLITGFST